MTNYVISNVLEDDKAVPFLKEYVRARRQGRNEKVGVLIGFVDENKVLKIGYSQCNPLDYFDKQRGLEIAIGRALTISDKVKDYDKSQFGWFVDDVMPQSTRKVLCGFIFRCKKYFQNATSVDTWINMFENEANIDE
jgi:hypothetical protein